MLQWMGGSRRKVAAVSDFFLLVIFQIQRSVINGVKLKPLGVGIIAYFSYNLFSF